MILSKELYDHSCPSYKKVIDELEQKLAATQNEKKIVGIIMKFSRSFLTPKSYWDCCFENIGRVTPYHLCDDNCEAECTFWEKVCCGAIDRAYFHLHYDDKWDGFCFEGQMELYEDKYLKLIDFQYADGLGGWYDHSDRGISYPHNFLKQCLRYFEMKTDRLPTKKVINRYEKMLELYPRIKAAYGNVDEWCKLLIEADDIAFFKDNVENRLSGDYSNVRLWKLYLGHLKERGQYKSLLHVYSKYCRFFLDDLQMKESYKEDMAKYGPIKLTWNNLFDFEVVNNMEEKTANVEMDELLPLDRNLCAMFYDTCQSQDFDLPGPVIHYILMNASHRVLRKLFVSCKYFFARKSTPICYGTKYGTVSSFQNENLILDGSETSSLFLKNTFITGFIHVDSRMPGNFISSLIPRISCCEAKFIKLNCQILSFDELKFLIQSGCVVDLYAAAGRIMDEKNNYVNLEEIMNFLPNIESLRLCGVKVNANTAHALSKMKFNGKISYFSIVWIYGEPFDPNEFLKYCIANKGPKLWVNLRFKDKFNADFVRKLASIMTNFDEDNVVCYI